jgi:ABC-type transporter Mla subunit MlaD
LERNRQDLVLGLVFFASIALLMWATIELTGLSFLGQPQERRVWFRHASGLREGDNVFVLGHRLGSVASIRYNADAQTADERIEVMLRLEQPVDVRDGYHIEIEPGSLLGGVQIQVDPGEGGTSLAPDAALRGSVRIGGLDAVGDLFADDQLGTDLKAIAAGVRDLVDGLQAGEGTLGALFQDRSAFDELTAMLQSARASMQAIETGNGALHRVIYSEQLGDDLEATVAHSRSIVRDVDEGDGPLARLVGDADLGARMDRIVAQVEGVTSGLDEGRGALGALLREENLADDVRRVTSGAALAVDNLNDPTKGLLGELLAGGETRQRFTTIVADFADMSGTIREGRGLIGKLIYDEELPEQFSRMMNQISRAIEDAREAAPIGTFFQVVSGAF